MKKLGRAYLSFLLHFGLAMLLFSILRLLFYFLNTSYFPNPKLINFIGGLRFDWMTITLLYSPFLLFFPFAFRRNSKLLKGLFYLSTIIAIAFNVIDFEYYKFTLKRTTADLFTTTGLGDDFKNLIFTFIIDYWYLVLLAAVLFYLTTLAYRKIQTHKTERLNAGQFSLFFLSLLVLYGLGARGGLQYKPLNVVQASQYGKGQNMSLVLNTPFTIIKSAFHTDLVPKNYFPEKEVEKIYTPVQFYPADSIPKRMNVVLIIAESFSKEYIGSLNESLENFTGYTPYLDTLISQSLSFTNAFANGKKSIEGLPSILSGIPTLMNRSFISSKYAANQVESIATILDEKGYSSTFYHGGENGTMGFQAYSQLAGIARYIGRNEYPDQNDYDGNWGIFDEPFLQFCIRDMDAQPKPFFTTIFTLSSHHPFTVPDQYIDRFTGGEIPILKSVQYADYALGRFFAEARKTNWFDNTLFILTADHASESYRPEYQNSVSNYRIPILFYCPKYIKPRRSDEIVQQDDIFPSVIDFLGFGSPIISFGTSVFSASHDGFAISYLNNYYQLIEDQYCLQFDGEKSIAFYNWQTDPLLQNNLLTSSDQTHLPYEEKLKAIIEQYNNRLINNKLLPE